VIVLFTDFGLTGPYTGQVKAVLYREAPGVPVVDLFADAPAFNPRAAAYLLAAYAVEFPRDTVFLCVVDPGVGMHRRRPVIVEADGRWFVGPDNGLFHVVARRATASRYWVIGWRPERLSASFHGRDLFAPVAARLARAGPPQDLAQGWVPEDFKDWPDDLLEVIYTDRYGNAMTGIRAAVLPQDARLKVRGHELERARTFGEVPPDTGFWYENANGLAEIAVNSGSAAEAFGIQVGAEVHVMSAAEHP